MNQDIGVDCNDLEGHGIVVDGLDVGEGDSGGSTYRIEDTAGVEYAVLIGHMTHALDLDSSRTCVDEERQVGNIAAGHAWYHKNNEYNLTL